MKCGYGAGRNISLVIFFSHNMKGGLDQTYLDNLTTGYARGQFIWVIYMVILTSMGLGGIPGPQFFFVNFLPLYMNSILRRGGVLTLVIGIALILFGVLWIIGCCQDKPKD